MKSLIKKPATVILVAATALQVCSLDSSANAGVTYDIRVLTGDSALGAGPGSVFSSFSPPPINAAGQIVFTSNLFGPTITANLNNFSVWSEAAGSIGNPGLVARTNDSAPGTEEGVAYQWFSTPYINDAGQTAFSAFLSGQDITTANNQGIWSEAAGSIGSPDLVIRTGDPALGAEDGVVHSSFGHPIINNAGQVAFRTQVTGAGVTDANDLGIWSEAVGSVGSPAPVAREGDAALPLGAGVVFSSNLDELIFNNNGQAAFFGRLTGPGVTATNDWGIWSEAAGSIGSPGLVAREGDVAPGLGDGVVYSQLSSPLMINDAGQVAFRGVLAGPGVTAQNSSSIWSEAAGSIGEPGLVARGGEDAHGTGTGVVYSYFYDPIINDLGQVTFVGALAGTGVAATNDHGIWSETAGVLGSPQLIAREGDAAPGTEDGVVFSGGFSGYMSNNAGQVAFKAGLAGAGISDTNDSGLWATDASGLLHLIVQEGDLIDVNDDPNIEDFRTVKWIDVLANSMGYSAFNDAGQLAYRLTFLDGVGSESSGLFVATIESLLGDITGDGFVGVDDLDILLANWGENVGMGFGAIASGDLSRDGVVGQADLDIVLGAWGTGTPPNTNIPEPGTLAMLAAGAGALLKRRTLGGRG